MNNISQKRTQDKMVQMRPKLDDLSLSERLGNDKLHYVARDHAYRYATQIQRMGSEHVADTVCHLGHCCFCPGAMLGSNITTLATSGVSTFYRNSAVTAGGEGSNDRKTFPAGPTT